MEASQSSTSTDYFNDDDPLFLEALNNIDFPQVSDPQPPPLKAPKTIPSINNGEDGVELEMPPPGQPGLKRRRSTEASDDEGTPASSHDEVLPSVDEGIGDSYLSTDTYGVSRFGRFGEYMSRKRAKLQIQNAELNHDRGEGSSRVKVFEGLQIYINGWTNPSVQDLRQLIIRHGGVFHAYLDRKSLVTHIVTCSLTPAKMREFQYMKVVRPEWLVESVKAGVLLSWQDFIFKAGPRIDESQGKKVAQKSLFDNFVAQQSIKNPEVLNTPKSVRIDVNSSPCTNSSEYQSPVPTVTPSAKSSPPTQAHYTPWIVPVPTTSSPEMPPLRQPPRPSTPDMSISASSTHRENPTLRPPTFSLSDPISQPDPSPPPPGQRPRQLTESPEHSDPAQPSQEPEVTPLPNTEHPSEPSMHLISTPSRASPLIYSTHLPPTPQSPRLLQLSSQSKPKYASFDSNPNAARVMANPAWRAAHTSVAPDFIEGYYRNSRLHHLASWKAELRGLVVEALEKAESGPSDEGGSASGEVERVHKDETEEEHDPVVRVLRENMGGKSGTVVLPSGEGDSNVSMRDAQLALHSPSKKFKGKEKDTKINDESQARVIMHCDFDSFFVSAGLVDRPHLRGKPVVVCHSQGAQGGQASTSEIASASYEARKFGIKGGMSLQQARKLCPSIITIPYEFQKYKNYSLQFYTILMAHADDLQAVSVDEALIDVTTSVKRIKTYISQSNSDQEHLTMDPAKAFADAIRSQVRKATNCEVSIGIAHNIMLARLASRKAKPAGSYHILPPDVASFLAPLVIDDLHGFGYSARQKAKEKLGTVNLGELVKKAKSVLCEVMGKATGEMLYNAVRGIDERKLESDKPRKSVSCDINYGIRFENNEQAETFIHQLAAEVAKRLSDIGMEGRSLILKIMKRDPSAPIEAPKFMGHGMCETFSKQIQIVAPGGRATSDGKVIGEHAWRLLKSFSFDPKELRGIAIQIQKLEKLSVGPDAEQRQAVLPFRRVEKHVENVDDLESKPSPLPIVALHDDAVEVVEVGKPTVKSRNPTAGSFNLPSFSQVDPSVFEALPEDIRRELEGEYERRGVPEPQLEAGPSKPTKDLISFLTVPKVQIAVKGSKPPNLKRITQQLAPRNKSTLASTKAAQLFSPKKEETASGSGVSKTTEVELRRLGIDLEVFAQLPEELQAEQLSAARMMEVNKGRGQAFGGPRKVLKPVRAPRYVDPGYVPYLPPPPPKANYGPPPTSLKRPGREKGSGVLRFTDTDEVMDVIGQWVDKFSEHPPHAKDVQFFASYLVKCVDSTVSPDSGLERGVAVMKWWLVLLRRKYAAWEDKNDDDEEDLWATPLPKNRSGFTSEDIGRAWWNAFKDVKSQMDIAARKKFGGRISLK